MSISADHALLLGFAKDALEAERSPNWRINPDMACEIHGTACDRLWDELKRQLALAGNQQIPPPPPSPKNQIIALRREFFRRLKERLPELIEEAVGEIDD